MFSFIVAILFLLITTFSAWIGIDIIISDFVNYSFLLLSLIIFWPRFVLFLTTLQKKFIVEELDKKSFRDKETIVVKSKGAFNIFNQLIFL